MKNRLEAELISIAHRILKLKKKSEIAQLQQETLQLYEKLSVLRFMEENYQDSALEIPSDIEKKLESTQREIAPEVEKNTSNQSPQDDLDMEEKKLSFEDFEAQLSNTKPKKPTQREIIPEGEKNTSNQSFQDDLEIEEEKMRFEDFEAQLSNAKPKKTVEPYEKETKNENSKTEEAISTTSLQENQNIEIEKETQSENISQTTKNDFDIRLNDRVAFEFHLFSGDVENFNRVIAQLRTFDTFEQAKDFITNVVKPDYNNWFMKEEYEDRFMEIVENRFL